MGNTKTKSQKNPQPSVAPEKLMSRLRAWLQPYRFVVDDELIMEYAKHLEVLSESDLDAALDVAARENTTNYAPSPGVVLEIAEEMIRGRGHPALTEIASWKQPTAEERKAMIQSPEWQALKKAVGRK